MCNCERAKTVELPRHQTVANSLLPGQRLIHYGTTLTLNGTKLASTPEFSRHAAPKLMIAQYRPRPRGRPAMTSWSLATTQLLRHRFWAAELLICGPQQLHYWELAAAFGLRSHNRTFANWRKILDCVTTTELLRTCGIFWVAQQQPNYCEPAKDFDLPNQ